MIIFFCQPTQAWCIWIKSENRCICWLQHSGLCGGFDVMEIPPVLHTWGVTHLFYNNCSQICGCSKPSAVDGLNQSLSLRQWKHIPAVCWGFTVSLLSAVSDTEAWTPLEKMLQTSWSSQQGQFLCPTGRQAELKDDLIQRQLVFSVLLLCNNSGLCSRLVVDLCSWLQSFLCVGFIIRCFKCLHVYYSLKVIIWNRYCGWTHVASQLIYSS